MKVWCHRYGGAKKGPNVHYRYDNWNLATWMVLCSWSWYWLLLWQIKTRRYLFCNANVSLSSYMFMCMYNVFKEKLGCAKSDRLHVTYHCCICIITIAVYVMVWPWVMPDSPKLIRRLFLNQLISTSTIISFLIVVYFWLWVSCYRSNFVEA